MQNQEDQERGNSESGSNANEAETSQTEPLLKTEPEPPGTPELKEMKHANTVRALFR